MKTKSIMYIKYERGATVYYIAEIEDTDAIDKYNEEQRMIKSKEDKLYFNYGIHLQKTLGLNSCDIV